MIYWAILKTGSEWKTNFSLGLICQLNRYDFEIAHYIVSFIFDHMIFIVTINLLHVEFSLKQLLSMETYNCWPVNVCNMIWSYLNIEQPAVLMDQTQRMDE